MNNKVLQILHRVASTADFSYVNFESINSCNYLGDNALHCVCVWGDKDAAEELLKAGININKQGEEGFTPLHNAIDHGHEELVKFSLKNGADPFIRTYGDQALTLARLNGEESICNIISDFIDSNELKNPSQEDAEHMNNLSKNIKELESGIDEHCN